jgi:signal transduction histidine kinase/HAMP domain-containing protein/CheY-like chemotaxis protein
VAGTWKDLTDSVNSMAGNLTAQVRNIATVTTAVANGDLSKKITVDVRGEILELKNTINTMVDQLRSFASEVTRVAREVGTEGKLGGQANVRGVAGTWKDLTDSVNYMASNLTVQLRDMSKVATAIANGDLTRKITVDVRGEILLIKHAINTMVDQLSSFAAEVTRVAREVGTEGKLGGQADVKGVAGTWKDLTDNVNSMASNLTGQVRNIAAVTTAVANGDLSTTITVDAKGEILELKNTINTMVDQLNSFAAEVTRVAREVGTEGKLGGQADVRGVAGTWKDLTDNVNSMASNLTSQVRNIATVTTAVARGDLSKKITVDVKGEILELKNTVNTMVDQLNSFASEVTRVAREVGTEGKLGGQADVKGVGGTWKDLTDNVNFMAGNLTNQVRGIAKVVTAVARGDLTRKLSVDAKGEIAELADTINRMSETLATFADQVTTVAREVGFEGKLGGQARVPSAAGTWKDLTDNVNQLAANLTTQVRAIAEVATAVSKGDLTRSISVEAQGEVAALKDNINEMIVNLKDATLKNSEQDWLKTNLAKFSRMLQGQKDLLTVGRLILSELAPVVGANHGVFYMVDSSQAEPILTLLASYASTNRQESKLTFSMGEGLVGQCAVEKQKISLKQVPPDYISIRSGLGESAPQNIIVVPVLFEGSVKAVLELASFDRFSPSQEAFLDQLTESIGIVLNTIEASMRTEGLLIQSQSLARELQVQQQELQQTNSQLNEKARLLAEQNAEVESKNKEIERSRQALEEKAAQLALTSKYKSEFLANMSHELRTPLNSLLILSDQLARNVDGNLSGKQVEFARTIQASGNDLLTLINDILDLSKIESGTVVVEVGEVSFRELRGALERTFWHVAEQKRLGFEFKFANDLPAAIYTDAKRLQQVLKNLLSNAFKFTEKGKVVVSITHAPSEWKVGGNVVHKPGIAFSVEDTGIGIPLDKQQIVFEAFQQADGSTSRKYGGTGLGLAISREIARMLGGDLSLSSTAGGGSVFTLNLPITYERSGSMTVSVKENVLPGSTPMTTQAEPRQDDEREVIDDRNDIRPGDNVLLIVENDPSFARLLLETAREQGFMAVVVSRGVDAVSLVRQLKPQAVTLDIRLPDMDGWRVLDSLKDDLETRHIPVQVITTADEHERALRMGARGILSKPVRNKMTLEAVMRDLKQFGEAARSVLVVSGRNGAEWSELLGGGNVAVESATSGGQALSILKDKSFSVVVVDAALPDMTGAELVGQVRNSLSLRDLPIILSTTGTLSPDEENSWRLLGQRSVFVHVQSPARLLERAMLFLHLRLTEMPPEKQQMLTELFRTQSILAGAKVLVVDDDVRNIFATTAILESLEMNVIAVETGTAALETLDTTEDIDVILMDVMMPGLDGYETMRAIRKKEKYARLPIFAVTAKAMAGDREKCIDAGATDYVPKPIDPAQLEGLLRLWLRR